jgi:hypothetical protein
MGNQKRRANRESLDVQTASKRLLGPLLRILFAAGLTKSEFQKTCDSLTAPMPSRRSKPTLRRLKYDRSLEGLISMWMTSPEFSRGAKGALPLRGRVGSFHALAKAAIPSRRPSALLKQLKDLRVVRIGPNDRVRLIDHFFPMRSENAFDLALFTQLTADFLRAHEVNLLSGAKRGEGLFQRIAHRERVDARIAPLFDRFARRQGQLLLASVDDWLARHRGADKSRRTTRLGLGVYVINDAVGRKESNS